MAVTITAAILPECLLAAIDPPSGDLILHTWLDSDRDGVWQQTYEPGVDAEVLFCYRYLGPPYCFSLRTSGRGVAIETYLVPGEYDVSVLAFDPKGQHIAPWYGYPGGITVTAGETAVVDVPFWLWATFMPPAAMMNEPTPMFDYAKGEKGPSFGSGDEPEGWVLTPDGWRRVENVTPVWTLDLQDAATWEGRPEARGWCPGLHRVRGLRCGDELSHCGERCIE